MSDRQLASDALSKVPAVTLGFWIIKILATTLGETGGDSVSMSWLGETTAEADEGGINGYLIGTAIFGVLMLIFVWAQIRARKFHPWLYWATIVASTTVGTTLADFCTRSLGIGYPGGSLLLCACVLASLFTWYKATGTISVNSIVSPREDDAWSGIVSFASPTHEPKPIQEMLRREKQIEIALREGRLRASPHFYNTEAQIDRLVEALPGH